MPKGIHDGHRKRLKEEFAISGFNSETPAHKIVEMLLFYSIPRKDTNEIAHLLINEFGSVAALLDASPEDIAKVDGAGENTALFFKLIRFIANYYVNEKKKGIKKFENYDELCDLIYSKYIGVNNETIAISSLDNACRLIAFDIIGEGDISSVGISTRQVIETALKRKAAGIIISHNHPNGQALPSSEDLEATTMLREALKAINVSLLDHIIISNDDYTSLRISSNYSYIFSKKEEKEYE